MMIDPTVVAYGIGEDSTAMLGAMHQRGIKPDLILFSDPGGEKRETYAYLPIINAWLKKVGFPRVTTVRYQPTRAPYSTLEGKCLANDTLPSLAFGKHSCSIVFKADPQHKYLQTWWTAQLVWSIGGKVRKAIGYDDGPQDQRRRCKADKAVAKKPSKHYDYWYPLQEWGITRVECERIITEYMGLPLPMKSACWFCPASKKSEVIWLRDNHPDLFQRALDMEDNARDGRHGLDTVKGLGRNFAWRELAHVKADEVEDGPEQLRP